MLLFNFKNSDFIKKTSNLLGRASVIYIYVYIYIKKKKMTNSRDKIFKVTLTYSLNNSTLLKNENNTYFLNDSRIFLKPVCTLNFFLPINQSSGSLAIYYNVIFKSNFINLRA